MFYWHLLQMNVFAVFAISRKLKLCISKSQWKINNETTK